MDSVSITYLSLATLGAVVCILLLLKLYKNNSGGVFKRIFINIFLMNIFQGFSYISLYLSEKMENIFTEAYLVSTYFFTYTLFTIYITPIKK